VDFCQFQMKGEFMMTDHPPRYPRHRLPIFPIPNSGSPPPQNNKIHRCRNPKCKKILNRYNKGPFCYECGRKKTFL